MGEAAFELEQGFSFGPAVAGILLTRIFHRLPILFVLQFQSKDGQPIKEYHNIQGIFGFDGTVVALANNTEDIFAEEDLVLWVEVLTGLKYAS